MSEQQYTRRLLLILCLTLAGVVCICIAGFATMGGEKARTRTAPIGSYR